MYSRRFYPGDYYKQKLFLVKPYQDSGLIIAVTEDGIIDIIWLKQAGTGNAMGVH